MSSIIEGYNYDIFISYRQKDNKGDRWVSEFVEALKTELESTFKEEISTYFDINPHDGLLETHDVDASLKEKLRCLIFIPIISRTYCDPKSFAWEHEFKAFIEMASKDQFGLKIKLLNGNVASRVLPVRIHDLDTNDTKECESALGSVLRGIEFIYREPGVNKPLRENDPKYPIQVNKVANAIKDLIFSLKNPSASEKKVAFEGDVRPSSNNRFKRLLILTGFLTLLIIAGILIFPFFKNDLSPLTRKTRNTIAVLPLKIIGDSTEIKYLASGLVESLAYMLTRIGNAEQQFSVIPTSDISEAISTHDARKRLGASLVISGSIQVDRVSTRLILNLIDTKEQRLLRSEKLDYQKGNNLILQDEIILVMVKMLGIPMKSQNHALIAADSPSSTEANEFYLKGKGVLLNRQSVNELNVALDFFIKAIEKDSTMATAYSGLSETYWYKYNYTKNLDCANLAISNINKAISLKNDDASIQILLGIIYRDEGEFEEGIKAFKRAIELEPLNEQTYIQIGVLLSKQGNFGEAEGYFKKAVTLKPDYWGVYNSLGTFYYFNGEYEKAIYQLKLGLQLAPDNQKLLNAIGGCYWQLQKLHDAIGVFERILQINPENSVVISNLGTTYFYRGDYEKAIYYYKQNLNLNPDNYQFQGWLADAYFWSNDKKNAAETFRIAIESTKRNLKLDPDAILSLVSFYGKIGMIDSAKFFLNQSKISEDPDRTDTYKALQIGQMYMDIGDKINAIKWIESAVKRGYGWIQIKYHPAYQIFKKDPDFQRMIEKYESPLY